MMRNILKTKSALLLFICLAISSVDALAQVVITSFAPTTANAGTTTVLTITGTGFGIGGPTATMYVEFRNADDGGVTFIQPLASEYVSWSATQILVRVPSDAGTGTFRVRNGGSTTTTAGSLTVPYDLMNVVSGGIAYLTDHINKQSGGYIWQMFTGFDANAPAKASFIRSLETWRCATFINWQLGATTATDAIAADGINIVRFDKAGQELPAGVLGRCTSRWTSCSSGGTWEWWVYELDIEFDQATSWQYGPAAPGGAQYDFESVSLHELGHGHQLGHVNDAADVMNYAITNGTQRRTLTSGNVNGGLAVMAKSTAANICSPLPMVPLNNGTCLLSCPAAPSNDAICGARVGAVDGTCLTSNTNVCSSGDLVNGCLTSSKSVWFKYTLTGGNNMLTVSFGTYTFTGNIETAIYSGTCGAPVFVGSQCGLASDLYSFTNLTAGDYFFQVSTIPGLEGNFSICATQAVNPCTPPAHDACATPVALPLNGTCTAPFTNCGASGDFNLGCATSNKTLWYSFTPTAPNDQVKVTFSGTSAGFGPNVDLQLYSGACGSLVPVAAKCGTKTSTYTFTGLTGGTTYRMAVSTDAAYVGTFTVCGLQSVNPCTGNAPANDLICNARTLPVDATCLTSQTNVCATADYTSGCASATSTVWYTFSLTGINTVLNVTMNNVNFGVNKNVQMMLASGLCTTPTFVSSYCGSSVGNIRFTNLSSLTTYYLSVSSEQDSSGTFDICGNQSIDCGVSTPANDVCAGAVVIPTNGTCTAGQTNVCATADTYGGCVTNTAGSVYYRLTITAGNAVSFTFPASTINGEIQTYLFSGSVCTSLTGIQTNCGLAGSGAFNYTNLIPGTYHLIVASEPGNAGDFTICATEYTVPPGTLTGPMQDCWGAIPMCAAFYKETNSYIGPGNQELAGITCLGTNESNSVWYSFSPQTAGTFAFNLSTLNDYDFAVYDITSYTCDDIPGLIPVRCNWSGTSGNTGLVLPTSATIPLSEPGNGVPTMPGLDVAAGSQYVLVVDNYSADNNGFTLTFTGTAQLYDNIAPVMTGSNACSSNEIILNFNEPIFCDSIFNNEFVLTNPITGTDYTANITGVTGVNCQAGYYTDQILVTHNGGLPTGSYRLVTNRGKIQDKCGNVVPIGTIYNFDYLQDIIVSSNVDAICVSGTPVVLTASGANILSTYTLNPGNLTSSINVLDQHGNVVSTTGVWTVTPFASTNYQVDVTVNGCTKSGYKQINLINNVTTLVDPVNLGICSGTTDVTAYATIDGVGCTDCTYQWSGGSTATTQNINVGSGTYNVIATTKQGCVAQNTATATINVASGGAAPSCNVMYVTPTGTGSGLTKTDPTDLQTAINATLCQNAVIKMSTGVYNFDNKIVISGYVTLEGGFNPTFTTKSSDLTGGTNSTTIRRSNTLDALSSTEVTAFSVIGGASLFRFQDLRIEMPGSTNVTKNARGTIISNFGIKMGSGCSNYNIVRCYIDAGKGADQ